MSRKYFQKFRKLLKLGNVNHSTKNSRNSDSKVEWKEDFIEKKMENYFLVYLSRYYPLFLEILENAVSFAIES